MTAPAPDAPPPPAGLVAARARLVLPGDRAAVAALWHDPRRWPAWREGCTGVVAVAGPWPAAGGAVTWAARAAGGRERVRERVLWHRDGDAVWEVEDGAIHGRQAVVLAPAGPGAVEVEVTLDFRLKDRAPLTVVRERLHTRRVLAASLRRSLVRLGRELAHDRELAAR